MMLFARYCQRLKGRPFAVPKQTSAPPFVELRSYGCGNWAGSDFDERQELAERCETSTLRTTRRGGDVPRGSAEHRRGLRRSHVEKPSLQGYRPRRAACEKRPLRLASRGGSGRKADDRILRLGVCEARQERKGGRSEGRRPTKEIHGTIQGYLSCIMAGRPAASMGTKRPSTMPVISEPLCGYAPTGMKSFNRATRSEDEPIK